MTAPIVPRSLNARLGAVAALYGVDAPSRATAGQSISITLVWQALAETEQDYKVFVHLLDADGRPVAQSDQVPAGWTRPTSGWLTGEFVSDAHTLELGADLNPGEYRLVAGMYAEDGGRLPAASGGDVIELGRIDVLAR